MTTMLVHPDLTDVFASDSRLPMTPARAAWLELVTGQPVQLPAAGTASPPRRRLLARLRGA